MIKVMIFIHCLVLFMTPRNVVISASWRQASELLFVETLYASLTLLTLFS